MGDNWWVILLVALVIALGLWWLLGGRSSDTPPAPRSEEPPRPLQRTLEPVTPKMPAPSVVPAEVPPPAPIPEPEALVAPSPPTPQAPAAPAAPADDLLLLKGVGPKLATLLGTLGVTRFDQIAAWTDADIARIDAQLGTFKGRATRDKWIEQAGYLAKGDRAGFEAKFGKLDG